MNNFKTNVFEELISQSRLTVSVSVPARLNLIGEHIDYNGGQVLPFAVNQRLRISLYRRPSLERFTYLYSTNFTQAREVSSAKFHDLMRVAMQQQIKSVPEPFSSDWLPFFWGVVFRLSQRNMTPLPLEGYLIKIKSDIPLGSGMSSSAALTCGLIATLAHEFNLDISLEEIAKLAQTIEHDFVGTPCGLMDQLAVCLSKRGMLTHIDFSDSSLEYKVQHIKPADAFDKYVPCAVDSQIKHKLSDSPYETRQGQCQEALSQLQHTFDQPFKHFGAVYQLVSAQDQDFASPSYNLTKWLQMNMPSAHNKVVARAKHVLTEIWRVKHACKALINGNLQSVDSDMVASHLSLRDDYEVSCWQIDLLNNLLMEWKKDHSQQPLPAILGPRLCGGGFGGALISLVRKDTFPDFLDTLEKNHTYFNATGHSLRVSRLDMDQGLTLTPNLTDHP